MADDRLLTIDELAAATGLSVRTTRYYAGLRLIPPPVRRGRTAWYDATHRARLEMVRALQDHGFTLQAIEHYLSRIPLDADVDELAAQRAMLTSWRAGVREVVDRAELEQRAGRALTEDEVAWLLASGTLHLVGGDYELSPAFDVAVRCLDLDLSMVALRDAETAIRRHMEALADDLTEVLLRHVVEPYRAQPRHQRDPAVLAETVVRLRQLVLESVVNGFREAADRVIGRSLNR